MKITKGFVAVRHDGVFLSMGLKNRWGSESAYVTEVDSIDTATVFAAPTERAAFGRHPNPYPHKFQFVPVEVKREVVQTGWGAVPSVFGDEVCEVPNA